MRPIRTESARFDSVRRCPFLAMIMLNHPKREDDGYVQIRNYLADMAASHLSGPGTCILHVIRKRVGEEKLTDDIYQRLRVYDNKAGALIDEEKWIDLAICIIGAHCEGSKILEELGIA